MSRTSILIFLFCSFNFVLTQGPGSGANGNLRLCVVEGRGTYKRGSRFCPILDQQASGVECVLGTDSRDLRSTMIEGRDNIISWGGTTLLFISAIKQQYSVHAAVFRSEGLDCLRRMSKGTVDFGVFYPEDLIAAQWANLDVLVTNELRKKPRAYMRSIVAVVNRRILGESPSSVHETLQNKSYCHPGHADYDMTPISDTIADYLIELVTQKSCNASMSIVENRIKGMAQFFGDSCMPGPWVNDEARDTELKRAYSSMCLACGERCDKETRYWGVTGALLCLTERAGDFTWAQLDNVAMFFGLIPGNKNLANPDDYAYLCRDGSWQSLTNNTDPCVWVNRPWPVVVAKRKASATVTNLLYSFTNPALVVSGGWQGALASLLETHGTQPAALTPPRTPLDHLSHAAGFREAYSQSGCTPSRHITICSSTLIENNKCEWLSEAGAVYGIEPPLQCMRSQGSCLKDVGRGDADVALGGSDWLVTGLRDYKVVPILHEATPIVDKANTVVAYVKADAAITNMADLRGRRASFASYDGFAWHSVSGYIKNKDKLSCHIYLKDYFSQICAPGVEKFNVSADIVDKFTSSCYKEGENVMNGEEQALRALVEDKSDVAFISMATYIKYKEKQIQAPWALDPKDLKAICPEENKSFCFISWSNIGHIFGRQNLTSMRHQEIINVFTQLDQFFGKNYPFSSAMFSIYGPFYHQNDVLFHNNTKNLATQSIFKTHPYDKWPLNFESRLVDVTSESCHLTDYNIGDKTVPTMFLLFVSLVVVLVN